MHVHTIDLQYHAGQERQEGASLEEYLEHAKLTGREALGLTDHIDLYWEDPPVDALCYEPSIEGWEAYRQDVDNVRTEFPDIQLLFAPEIGDTDDLTAIPDRLVDISDFFICEIPFPSRDVEENTAAMIERVDQLSRFSDRVDRPIYLAHPFRSSVDEQFVKNDIRPWITDLARQDPDEVSREAVNSLFLFDVAAVARAAADRNLPLEINGVTHHRLRTANLPAAFEMLWAGYRIMQEEGAVFVPGSDQHGIRRRGKSVPWETFDYLGIDGTDLDHLEEFGIDIQSSGE